MNVRIFWVRAMKCMWKSFWGEWSLNPCQLQGKNPLYRKISPEEDRTRDAVNSEPRHYQRANPAPNQEDDRYHFVTNEKINITSLCLTVQQNNDNTIEPQQQHTKKHKIKVNLYTDDFTVDFFSFCQHLCWILNASGGHLGDVYKSWNHNTALWCSILHEWVQKEQSRLWSYISTHLFKVFSSHVKILFSLKQWKIFTEHDLEAAAVSTTWASHLSTAGMLSVQTSFQLLSMPLSVNNNRIERRNSRFVTISSLFCELSPNTYVLMAWTQSCANHMQHNERLSHVTCHMPCGMKGQHGY